ncbi:MAG: hypothetical protein DRI95_04315, partial [Bacteroidetes bacterium]
FWTKNNTDREVKGVTEKVLSVLELKEEASSAPRIYQKTGLHGEFEGYALGENYYFDNHIVNESDKVTNNGDYQVPDDIQKIYSVDYVNKFQADFEDKIAKTNNEQKKKELQAQYEEWKVFKGKWFDELGVENVEKLDWENISKEKKSEWTVLSLWPTELQASINPGYIIILTPLVVGFFGYLARRGKEPSTPAKIGYGLVITSLSMLVMVGAAIVSDSGDIKTSVGWLFGIYGIITVGELFLSPMGLSLVSKLSPKRIAAIMMGGWFLSTAIGNKLSGVLSGFWDLFEKKEMFFLVNVVLTGIAAVGIFILLPWLRRVVKEYSE